MLREPTRLLQKIEAEQGRRSLPVFVRQAWPVIEPTTVYLQNWHIDLICEHLEAVTRGEITRLLINLPPRYMKSILVSVLWPVWEWITRPSGRWLFASYSASLATKHSVDRRTVIQSDWYQERWGNRFALSSDQNVKTEFQNDRRGVMVATSVGGSATGKGGSRVIVDDPHNPLQAESDVQRQEAVTFFDRTLSNRLDDKKRDAIVVVMQRLHQEDLSARCLELGYTHVCIPGVSEGPTTVVFPSGRTVERADGDLLWPDREGPKEIEEARISLMSYGFAGQYQQRPVPAGGGLFKQGWFAIVEAAPAQAQRVRFWDLAASLEGDYTVGARLSRTTDGMFYVEHVERGRWAPHERDAIIKQTAELDGLQTQIWIEQEPGSSGKSLTDYLIRSLAGYVVHAERASGSKTVRAQPFAAQCEAGNVKVVKGRWNRDWIDELAFFPFGKHDDQVDAASGAFNKLALAKPPHSMTAGRNPLAGYRG